MMALRGCEFKDAVIKEVRFKRKKECANYISLLKV